MLAIIGASGAGKTTLLNFLSGKTESPNLTKQGEILLNNQPISPHIYDVITSYVMQDDVLEQTMTPLEILLFTAKMKLNLPLEEIEKRVQKMIYDLNLYKCRNTRIGNEIERGVSGGERKRTSIAVELISDPKIIFLDEPTTGLDSFNAYQLINNLNNLALEENKLIIFTIHQPSSEIYELLDKLLILANGKTVFFGDKNEAYTMFNINQLPVPNSYNPFEYFLEITTVTAVDRSDVKEVYPKLNDFKEDDKIGKYTYYCDTLANNYLEYRNTEGTI